MTLAEIVSALHADLTDILENGDKMPQGELRRKCYETLLSLLDAERNDPDGKEMYHKVRVGVTTALAMIEGVIPTE